MSDQHDADRWRELADLLGLPPDENKSAKPSPQTHKEEKAAPPHIPEHDRYTAEPVAEDSFEPPTYEEVEVVETVFAVEEIGTPMSSESVEAEPGAEEGESTERRRRGADVAGVDKKMMARIAMTANRGTRHPAPRIMASPLANQLTKAGPTRAGLTTNIMNVSMANARKRVTVRNALAATSVAGVSAALVMNMPRRNDRILKMMKSWKVSIPNANPSRKTPTTRRLTNSPTGMYLPGTT